MRYVYNQVPFKIGHKMKNLKDIETIGIIGAGKLGEALIQGFLKSQIKGSKICIFEIDRDRSKYISEKYNVRCLDSVSAVVKESDLIIIAVKPIDVKTVAKQIGETITPGKIVLTFAAATPIEYISKYLPKNTPIIRGMPNLAVSVREGMTAIAHSENCSSEQVQAVIKILSLLGKVVQVNERYLNVVTALSGSGPAYIALIIDSLADAGVRFGLPKDISLLMATQTVLGGAKMLLESNQHPALLRDMVATPAGTTIEALLKLERGGFRAMLVDAVTAATKRAEQLERLNLLNKNDD